ncbi:hypothetical protein C0Q70_13639 [Pomacea canaliculata]|uniref:Uncharacterized protein n=1 Tax=Pomacea canaliculata TaxID=400727 RepID=A0A2T7NXT0_POMCA|nr:hypothetical protein C0Q70_13639 [Pomacea canaliculata]
MNSPQKLWVLVGSILAGCVLIIASHRRKAQGVLPPSGVIAPHPHPRLTLILILTVPAVGLTEVISDKLISVGLQEMNCCKYSNRPCGLHDTQSTRSASWLQSTKRDQRLTESVFEVFTAPLQQQ